MNELHTFQLSDGVNLHLIREKKFTINSVSFFIRSDLTKENAAKMAMLSKLFKTGCREYPSVTALNRQLQELMGCSMDIFTFKKDCQLCLCLNFQFTDKTDMLPKVLSLAGNILLCPKTFLNRFSELDFSNSLFALSNTISSLKDDKTQYTLFRLYEEMARDAVDDKTSRAFGISADGSLKELSLITPESLYKFYSDIITSAPIDIYCVGPKNADEIKPYFDKIPFFNMARKKYKPFEHLKGINTAGRRINENEGLNQTNFAMGFTFSDNNIYAAEVMNELLSGGGSSLLFDTLRQSHGLCYSISSKIFPHIGVLAVHAGIQKNSVDKTAELVRTCVSRLKEASQEDVSAASQRLIYKYRAIPDSPQEITGFCFSCRINGITPHIDEYVKKLSAVTVSEIAETASSLREQIIYTLS